MSVAVYWLQGGFSLLSVAVYWLQVPFSRRLGFSFNSLVGLESSHLLYVASDKIQLFIVEFLQEKLPFYLQLQLSFLVE